MSEQHTTRTRRAEAVRIYRELLAAGEPLSSRALAARSGVSQSTAARAIAATRAEDESGT